MLFWLSLVTGLAIYVVMVAWSLPRIAVAANGATPFDLRPTGYGFDDALTFLSQLSDDGRAHYLNVQHWLDTAYPLLLALALGSGIMLLTPERFQRFAWLLALSAVPGMVFDYVENHRVAGLLSVPVASIDEAMVASASQATVLKSLFTTAAMTLFTVLLVIRLVRYLSGRRRA